MPAFRETCFRPVCCFSIRGLKLEEDATRLYIILTAAFPVESRAGCQSVYWNGGSLTLFRNRRIPGPTLDDSHTSQINDIDSESKGGHRPPQSRIYSH
jgi:hypothetical protein